MWFSWTSGCLAWMACTATREIRQLYPSARIVVVTDYDDQDVRDAASQAGACAYVLKQNLTDLPEMIRSIAGEKASSG